MTTWVLIAANILLPCIYIYRRCIRNRALQMNHFFFFSAGFLFYFLSPVAVGVSKIFEDPNLAEWYEIFDSIEEYKLQVYLIVILLFYLSFMAGGAVQIRVGKKFCVRFKKELLIGFCLILFLYGMGIAVKNRAYLFKGYTLPGYRINGTASAVLLAEFTVFLLYLNSLKHYSFGRAILNVYAITYLILSLILLSLGGRLYIVSTVMGLFAFYSCYRKKIHLFVIAAVGCLGSLLMGAYGIIRLGTVSSFGFSTVILYIFLEPIYTSYSLVYHLAHYPFEAFNVPRLLMGDFLNLIPSAILPEKASLLPSPSQFGYTVYNPLGAMHSYVSCQINFGWIGMLVVIFLFSVFLNHLYRTADDPLKRTVYIMMASNLTFTFFRDPFSVSIVKILFEFSMLFPVLVMTGLLLCGVLRIGKRTGAAG